VKSTKENLEAAIKGETYERDTMYPEFIAAAKAEGNKDALRAFNYAKTAEAEHAKMYEQDLKDLANQWGKTQTYWVCTVCGYTVPKLDFDKCPSCFNPKDKYVEVK
jgi:rubrerythrin